MSPQVTAALISGGAALVVALFGIVGAIAAQLVATRRAFANSLRLFEQEYDKRERERADQARREDEYRFADQRRGTYARLLRTAADLYLSYLALNAAAEQWEYVRNPETRSESQEDRAEHEERTQRLLLEAFPRWAKLHAELEEVEDEIELLGSAGVRHAAAELADIVSERPELGGSYAALAWAHVPIRYSAVTPSARKFRTYAEARAGFLAAARGDLGIGPVPAAHGDLLLCSALRACLAW
jgi:hypothetical protein